MSRRAALRLAWLVLWAAASTMILLAIHRAVPAWATWLDRQGIDFAWPRLLWTAAAALLVPLLAPLGLTDLPRAQQALQVLLRMGLLVVLALAAAGPRLLREAPRQAQIVHLVDRSESVPDDLLQAAGAGIVASYGQAEQQARAQAAFVTTGQEPPRPRVDVVAFDGAAERLPWPATAESASESAAAATAPPALDRRPVSGRETDLASALNLALGLLDGHTVPHVVLWSDGIETRGDASQLLGPLRAAGVRVHLPALPALPESAEVVVDRLELPAKVRANVPFPVAISVQSSSPAEVRCRVQTAGQTPPPVTRTLPAGTTRVELGELRLRQGGPAELHATCDLVQGRDRFASNNQLRARVVVLARPKILYVEGASGQAQYLTRALVDDFEVEVRGADGLPRSLGGLKHYQAVIVSDVPRVSAAGVPLLTDGDMRNLHAYAQQGGGLLVIGGENSLGSGGYQDTYLDKHVLPVRMDVESAVEMPTIAMMLVMDKSGSMAGQKMELAKEAARATVEALSHEDRIGVVAFDSEAQTAVRLQRAGNRYRIATDVGRLQPSGGTHIYPGLEIAYQALVSVQAKVKHVIVMTDGQAPRAGIDALVRQMRRSGITVSSVGVGGDLDRGLLEAIADRGGGRVYFTDRPETLPRIFVRETKLVSGESVVEQTVRARRVGELGRIDLLRGVPIEAAPALTGFLPTKVKKGAEEILRLTTGQPLLVRWRLGLGKVSVWTSDLKNRWAAGWLDWPAYAVLVRQIVRDLQQEDLGAQVAVQLLRERDQLRIAVDAVDEDDSYMQGLVGLAAVTLPDGTTQTLALPEVATGRYETTVPMTALGPYDVHATLRASPEQPVLASGRATAVHPYPDEHRLPDPGSSALAALVQATGGRQGSGPADWLDTGGATHQDRQWLWPDLVRLALLLLLIDVLLRRVRLGRATRMRWYALQKQRARP